MAAGTCRLYVRGWFLHRHTQHCDSLELEFCAGFGIVCGVNINICVFSINNVIGVTAMLSSLYRLCIRQVYVYLACSLCFPYVSRSAGLSMYSSISSWRRSRVMFMVVHGYGVFVRDRSVRIGVGGFETIAFRPALCFSNKLVNIYVAICSYYLRFELAGCNSQACFVVTYNICGLIVMVVAMPTATHSAGDAGNATRIGVDCFGKVFDTL